MKLAVFPRKFRSTARISGSNHTPCGGLHAYVICAGVLASFLLPAAAKADSARTIIVMDGSGSMWGQIGGRPKLEIARQTVKRVLAGLPADREIGLLSYGHRRKGDCGDIELLVPPGAGTAGAITEAVETMQFLGKTPLTEAVRQAATTLRSTEEAATVVLVTDGLETCEADPCALGRELEASGVNFTAHVVGFGLSEEDGARVACLAKETGGRYIQARDAKGLNEALTQTIAEAPAVVEEPAPAPVEVPKPAAELTAPDSAPVLGTIEVTWSGPGGAMDFLDIIDEGEERTHRARSSAMIDGQKTVTLRVPAEPGTYDLRYIEEREDVGRRVLAKRMLTVTDVDFAVSGPASVATGESFPVSWVGPAAEGDYVDLIGAAETRTHQADADAYVADGNPARLIAPVDPGAYQLRYIAEGPEGRVVRAATPITVMEPKPTLSAPQAVRPGASFPVEWRGPATASHWIDIVTAGHEPFSGELGYFYLDGESPGMLTAPSEEGSYELRYVIEDRKTRRKVILRRPITVSTTAE